MTAVELTRFKATRTEDLLAARPAMLADFAADRKGFRVRPLGPAP